MMRERIAKTRMHDVARPPRPCRKGEGALATAGFVTTLRVAKAMVATALMLVAGVVNAGESAPMVIDLRTDPRESGGDETLTYSSLWDGGEGATVTIAQDGTALAANLTGEGEQAWSVPSNGTYVLTHTTYVNGTAGKVETARFVVTGKAEPPEITNVVATPSEPWNGRVSISFNVVNSPAAACPDWNRPCLSIVATDNVTGSNYVSEVSALSAETDELLADALAGSNGTHEVTWDFTAQGIDFVSSNVTFTVAYIRPFDVRGDWCVIDLSGGPDAESYPVSYLDAEPAGGFNTDAYKTTNLVMRLVEPGTFTMGADRNAVFGNHGDQLHSVTLTQPFYCAVFETTQRQWELVKGDRPSWFNNDDCYATRPVEQVSYDDIRGGNLGSQWPTTNSVDAISFLGYLRSRTSLASLDLPTEAQWEYACRAGTVTDLNNGKNVTGEIDMNLDEVARNWWNGGSPNPNLFPPEFPAQNCEANNGTATVGSYLPNAWGLYDMHGNVWEWCLDWWAYDLDDTSVTNPSGSSSDSCRLKRGGCWTGGTPNCTSYSRFGIGPSDVVRDIGFRLVRTLSSNLEGERSAEAAAGAERAGTVCAGTASEAIRVGKDFTADEVKLTGYEGTYDGQPHTIGIATNAIPGLALRYAGGSPGGLALPFGDEVPLFTNVCEATVWVEASAPGYITFATNATVTITPASLTITAKDQTYRYNGMQQGESDPIYATPEEIAEKVIVNGLKGGDTIDHVELGGEATDAGWYPIEPKSAVVVNPNNGDVTGNYTIEYVTGTLTILAPAEVADVVATPTPESPWDGKVSLSFTVTNSPAFGLPNWNAPFLSIVATDNETGSNYVSVASALSADSSEGLAAALHGSNGTHRVTWDMDAQGIKFASTNVTFTVAYLILPEYCIIDLSGGPNATSYPVTYVSTVPPVPNVPGGITNDLYKTTNLVMRLIGPGTFTMGQNRFTSNPPHEVTLTQPFYCAVFETTQKQWELVTGGNPSQSPGGTRPVEKVSYNAIRGKTEGAKWPATNSVDEASFLGVLRLKTGLAALDLPTEAQWEYACRAGSTNLYNGVDTQDMDLLGRYADNQSDGRGGYSSKHTAVGSYLPNAWGLYDMHGNVWEWCLDWFHGLSDASVTNPTGPPSGSDRMQRGGSWGNAASTCTSEKREKHEPSDEYANTGFRLFRTLSDDFESERDGEAVTAVAERAGTVCAGVSPQVEILPAYTVTVVNGSTTNSSAKVGSTVTITAGEPSDGEAFVQWTSNDGVDFDKADAAETTFVMPGKSVTVTAVYAPIHINGLNDAGYPWTGKPVEPEVSVTFEGVDIALQRDTDYAVSYTSNTNEGTATVTVTMLPPRLGSQSALFTILPQPVVSNVTATASDPWDGTVDFTFTTGGNWSGLPDWNAPFLSIVATDNETGSNYVSVASALSADSSEGLAAALHGSNGTHRVTWDFRAQGIEFTSTNVTFTVTYLTLPDYCIIDLSSGTNAASYPVTYVSTVPPVPNVPGGTFNTDAYKTTNLVMRLIAPGTFTMGDATEFDNLPHTVTLTRPFYCAVFETTQKQWELVTGDNPSGFKSEADSSMRPVEKVSWNMIRGDSSIYDWPNVKEVDPESFLGVLRLKSGLDALDFPTEAQWEYACRAGTATKYSYGNTANGDYMWYGNNSTSQTHVVGTKLPNAWGLYDMHGNVFEWCLDWYASNLDGGNDPKGSSSGSYRVGRGGSWDFYADVCASSYRSNGSPSFENNDLGFRLFRTLSNNFESERSGEAVAAVAERAGTVCAGVSPAIAIIPLKPFEDGDVKLTDYAGEYDGEGHTIGVEATTAIAGLELAYAAGEGGSPGGLALPFGAELPLFTNVCEVTVWVEARAPGYITATNSATVKIGPRSITNATVVVGDVVFTGVPAEPVPSVTDGDPSIITTNDYTVAYSSNDLPGEGTVTLTGTGNYTGTTEAKFRIGVAELSVELGWKLLKATGTYFAQLKVTCTGGIAAGIDDLKFLFADRVGADGKTAAALWRTPLRAANPDTTTYGGATYRHVALDASQITAVGVPVTFGVADLASATIPVAERTIEMYVRTGVSPEGGNAGAAQVDDFVGYVVWTSGGVTRAVPVVAGGSQAAAPLAALPSGRLGEATLPSAALPSPARLNASLAVGVLLTEDSSPYCQVTAFSVEDGVMRGKVEVGADGRAGALGANATVTVLGAASLAGPFAEVSAVTVAADGSFSLTIPPGAKFFKLRIDVKEVVK